MTTNPDWEELGRALKRARGSRKIAPSARAIGISSTQLSNYEKASTTSGRPPMERLIGLARYYGVDPIPLLDLAGYDPGVGLLGAMGGDAGQIGGGGMTKSEGEPRVPDERSEKNVVRISAQAIGWELSATYTDAEDRQRALEDIGKVWSSIMGGTGNGGAVSEGREDQPG